MAGSFLLRGSCCMQRYGTHARAGIVDFQWHDLRYTAITRMAQKLPNVIELAAVSGHRSLAMLKRYYHSSATDLARKLG
ncbi:tyrosine-type recombinase/integrase [Burkholderia gladioli]|uniref:tyrosine-type recombinase/integrase n=2 Tax=Burkholderia gladioli TaxID=28095 RepID=UPI003019B775